MLDIFKFKNYPVRFVFLNDEIWFVAMDIASILEYEHCPHMLDLVEKEDKRVENPQKIGTAIFRQSFNSNTFRVSLINESGLYACIFGSTKTEAKTFKKWVTSELLPTLRKTGKYEVSEKIKIEKELEASEIEKLKLEIQNLKLEKELHSTQVELMQTQGLVIQNQDLIKQSLQAVSILEEEKFEREYYLNQLHEITKEHPLFSSLIQFALTIKNEEYMFPLIGYTVKQILGMFTVTSVSAKRFANLCSDLYFLNKNKKPNESGTYKYVGDELIYPSLILFKLEDYSWGEIKEKFEINYKLKFPTSNRKAFTEVMKQRERRLKNNG